MQVLIIGDIHGRKFWRQTIENNIDKVDKVIFLGDYLDPYPEEIKMSPELMECKSFDDNYNLANMLSDIISLKKSEPEKYILLTGNHTDSYIWSAFHAATRTDYKNWEKYHKFFLENLKYFNLVWIEDNCIFSHAGISEEWAKVFCVRNDIEFKSILETARILQNIPIEEGNNKLIHLLGQISHYRYGDYNYGSCEWADVREHIDKITDYQNNKFIGKGEEGTFQVFGHTQLKAPLICDKWICLDCRRGFIFDTITHTLEDESNNNL